MATSSLVKLAERTAKAAAANVVARCEAIDKLIGEREIGMDEVDILSAIAVWLTWRDDPAECQAYMEQIAGEIARASAPPAPMGGDLAGAGEPPPQPEVTAHHRFIAWRVAVREFTEMERRIERRGGLDVVLQQIARRFEDGALRAARLGEKQMAEAERIEVLPAYPPVQESVQSIVAGHVTAAADAAEPTRESLVLSPLQQAQQALREAWGV